ncbi:MAG: ATP-binding cassette domain-containing protein, partial [Pseudomonadota bacterium]
MTAADVALEIDGVGYSYGARRALDGVSLRAEAGAFTVLLGPNGAGKTTLFNLITRLFATRSGRIAICGIDVARRPRAALARIGVVFQSRAIDPHLSVGQNLL